MKVDGIRKLCELFGCSHESVRSWQAEGLPVIERGGAGRPSVFDSAAVHAWLVERAVRKAMVETPRDRLWRAQAESVEFDLKQKRGQFVPVEVIEPKWTAAVVAAREQLLRTRRRIVEKVERAKTRKEREQAVGEEHEAFLRTLADWRGANEEEAESGAS